MRFFSLFAFFYRWFVTLYEILIHTNSDIRTNISGSQEKIFEAISNANIEYHLFMLHIYLFLFCTNIQHPILIKCNFQQKIVIKS